MNKAAEPFDVKANVSAEEWQARVDLAAAYRLVDHHRWTDMLATHISMRVPGEPHHFLINPFGLLFGEITASSLLKVDEDGNILLPSPFPFNSAGFVIHGAIHEARPEVNCVLHLHTADGIAVSAQEDGLLPLSQIALACLPKISYHEYEGVALNMEERKRLVADLGSKDMMILRNHGTLACGTTVSEAWVNIYALERSCSIQVRAMTGRLHHAPKAAIETVARQMEQTNQNSVAGGKPVAGGEQKEMSYSERAWPAMLRLLDRIDPGYKN
jgi:ribulose-5-phosphate 4-epimerase/fuculose-1-phosphate aldolase